MNLMLHRLIGLAGQNTRSPPHRSFHKYPPNREFTPIVLLGFARSGTTTFQKRLAQKLNYNSAFEPIAFNHSHYPATKFHDISRIFRAAPDIQQIADYKIAETTLSALHLCTDCPEREGYIALLQAYIAHLLEFYGHNVVIKELRLLYNLPTLIEIFSRLGTLPLFVFLQADPLMTLYTYYRLGGLIDGRDDFGLRVNELYAYRVETCSLFKPCSDLIKIHCINKWEKLLLSISLEHSIMNYFRESYSERSIVVYFEAMEYSIRAVTERLDVALEDESDHPILRTQRHTEDRFFRRLAKKMVRSEILDATGIRFDQTELQDTSRQRQLQYWVTHLQNRILCL